MVHNTGIITLQNTRFLAGLVVAMTAVTVPVISSAQKAELTMETTPSIDKPTVVITSPTNDEILDNNETSVQTPPPIKPKIPAEVEVETQNLLNELRREFLDNRANAIDWWLAVIAIVLTIFGIVIPIAGFLGFRRFREIETKAKNSANAAGEHAKEAKRHMEDIERYRDRSEEIIRNMSVQSTASNSEKDRRVIENVTNHETSLINKTVDLANSLQQQGKKDDAIEKWRALAHILEGHDNDLAAIAWFSVGHLLESEDQEHVKLAYDNSIRLKPDYPDSYNNRGNANYHLRQYDAAIADYDKAITLKPDYPEAYCNRGNAKYMLGIYNIAIADYEEAIRLKPDYSDAFFNRGNVKYMLRQYDAAIADYDEGIRLKPIFPGAYCYRGESKVMMGYRNEARLDLETSLKQAREFGDAELVAQVEQSLRNLDKDSSS